MARYVRHSARPMPPPDPVVVTASIRSPAAPEATRLKDLSPQQWKSGIAAWLGWLFDGLELHLYTLAAALQTGVNIGVIFGATVVAQLSGVLSGGHERYVFLIGVAPALLVFWIRRHVPEPEAWQRAEEIVGHKNPGARELFRGKIIST